MKNFNALMEALNKKQIQYVNKKLKGNLYDSKKHHINIFGGDESSSDRIKIPLEHHIESNSIREKVRKRLNQLGYDIEDYRDGLASQEYIDKMGNQRKRVIKIGKLLNSERDKNLINMFSYDPTRSRENIGHEITLSRDKYDIAGMTSGREWESQSCMNLPHGECDEGGQHEHIKEDLKHGSLVAYLTKKGDDEIEAPLGRVLIKKYTSDEKIDGKYHHIWRPEKKSYGNVPEGFLTSVENYMIEKYPAKENVDYTMENGLYDDGRSYIDSIKKGLHHKDDGTYINYNANGEKEDFINIHGEHMPSEYNGIHKIYRKKGKLHREYGLPAMIDDEGKSLVYAVNGMQHRDGDNPAVINPNSRKYCKHGLLHRPYGKPALIEKDGNGNTVAYYEYGLLHREGDRPSLYSTDSGMGKRYKKYLKVQYHKRGLLDHPYKPASKIITVGKDGKITIEKEYKQNNLLHREGDKPAYIRYYINHNDLSEYIHDYMLNGKYHRDNGKPAMVKIVKDENGKILHKKLGFYENGIEIKGYTHPYMMIFGKTSDNENDNVLLRGNVTTKYYRHDSPNKPIRKYYVGGKLIKADYYHDNPNKPISIEKFKDADYRKFIDESYQYQYHNGDYVNSNNIFDDKGALNETKSNLYNFRKYQVKKGIYTHAHLVHFDHEGYNYIYNPIENTLHKLLNGKLIGSAMNHNVNFDEKMNRKHINDNVNKLINTTFDSPDYDKYNNDNETFKNVNNSFKKHNG